MTASMATAGRLLPLPPVRVRLRAWFGVVLASLFPPDVDDVEDWLLERAREGDHRAFTEISSATTTGCGARVPCSATAGTTRSRRRTSRRSGPSPSSRAARRSPRGSTASPTTPASTSCGAGVGAASCPSPPTRQGQTWRPPRPAPTRWRSRGATWLLPSPPYPSTSAPRCCSSTPTGSTTRRRRRCSVSARGRSVRGSTGPGPRCGAPWETPDDRAR